MKKTLLRLLEEMRLDQAACLLSFLFIPFLILDI